MPAKVILFAVFIISVHSVTCENKQIEQFVEIKENVISEVITNTQNAVWQSSCFSGSVAAILNALYSNLIHCLNHTLSNEALKQFYKAYFLSCYGPEQKKTTTDNAIYLLQNLVTLLAKHTEFI